jgi:sec-independent protein translocase protein TatB
MFSLGTTEILVILVVALLIIGPSKLPDVARTLGKGMAEFRRMSSDVKKTVDLETKLSDMERQEKDKEADAALGSGKGDDASEQGRAAAEGEGRSGSRNENGGDMTADSGSQARRDSEESDKGSKA